MKYECYECCDDLQKLPCIVIIPGDTIGSRWTCIVTPWNKNACFKPVE
jgi:hypothetical protein